jgi:hypothetical protein
MSFLAIASTASEFSENDMSKRVFRTDLRHQPVSESLPCVDPTDLLFRPDAATVEECVHMLLEEDEVCLGTSERRSIMRGPKVVGYMRIVDDRQELRESSI